MGNNSSEFTGKLSEALSLIARMPSFSHGALEDAAGVISEIGCLVLNTHRVGIWSMAESGEKLQSISYYESGTGKHNVQGDLDLGKLDEYVRKLKDDRVIVINDMKEKNPFSPIIDEYDPEICAMLDAPIRIGGRLAGVVCIEQKRSAEFPGKREWTAEEQDFAASLADFTALAMGIKITREVEERSQLMLDSSPLATSLFDKDTSPIDCNLEAARMFGFGSKKEYMENINSRMSLCQPDDAGAKRYMEWLISEALQTGKSHAEILMVKSCGTPVPVDATYARVPYKGDFVVVEYLRDLSIIEEAHETVKLLLDASPFFVEIWDANLNLMDCNERVKEFFGLSDKAEFVSRYDELSPKYQPCGTLSSVKSKAMAEKALRDGRVSFEWLHLDTDGNELPVITTFVRLIMKGEPTVVGYNLDLREIKAAEAKEREANELNEILIDAAPFGFSLWGEDYKPLEIGVRILNMLGGENNKEKYLNDPSAFWPERQPCGTLSTEKARKYLDEALISGRVCAEWKHLATDGETFITELTIVRRNFRGKNVLLVYERDLREVKAAEAKEQEANEFNRLFIDSAPFGFGLWDEDFNLVEVGEQIVNMLGAPDKETYKKNYADYWTEFQPCGTPSAKKARQNTAEAMANGFARFEWMHRTSDGEPLPIECTLVRRNIRGKNLVLSYESDLRPIKAAMDKERAALMKNRAKSRFLAQVSHEIRTPMNAILGITEIQLRDASISKETEDALFRIHNSSHMLLALINNLLDLSKVDEGKMEIIDKPYELASLIVDIAQMNIMYIGSKRIEFSLTVDPNLPSILVGDEIRIKQVFNNMLSNAFKYTNEGEVKMSISLGGENGGGGVTLTVNVSDTGKGMTKEQVGRLFSEEYVRFHEDEHTEGTGLGAAIAYRLVKMMNGDIQVESEPGVGTRITIHIPQKVEGTSVLGEALARNLQNFEKVTPFLKKNNSFIHEPMPYGRVLVVDDMESNLYVAKGLMMPYKLLVDTADSGQNAIDKIKAGEIYDIIFLDHMMPGMDGIEAAKILREMGYEHPVVALTANALVGQNEVFMQNGFSGFISKPIDTRLLDTCLHRFIRDKQPPDVIKAARDASNFGVAHKDITVLPVLQNSALSNVPLESLQRDSDRILNTMQDIIEQGNFSEEELKLYTIQAHSAKNLLRNIGEEKLAETAAALEETGWDADTETIKSETMPFLTRFREIINAIISAAPGEPDNIPEANEDSEFLRERFLAIQTACEAYNRNMADDIIDAMNQSPRSRQTKESLTDIEMLLLRGHYEEAAELAGKAAGRFSGN